MTLRLVKALQARGNDVTVYARDITTPHSWDGITIHPFEQPAGGVMVFHADWFDPAVGHPGPTVAICHNARIGVQVGLINTRPTLVTVNSHHMHKSLGGIVVHPPVAAAEPVSGDCLTLVNLTQNKLGPFWDLVRAMRDRQFLAVAGGYGPQVIKVEPNVDVIDHVPFAEMREKVWSRTRILLVPSRTESWSMVASEAMAHGIPVVANALPELTENIGPAGVLVGGPLRWVTAIDRCLNDWDHLSAVALSRAAEQAARSISEVEAWCDAVEALC